MDTENKHDKIYDFIAKVFVLAALASIPAFFVSFYLQEREITNKLEKCSFYTVATPSEMTTSIDMYFNFYYKGNKYDEHTTVGSGDLGLSYTRRSAMSTGYGFIAKI